MNRLSRQHIRRIIVSLLAEEQSRKAEVPVAALSSQSWPVDVPLGAGGVGLDAETLHRASARMVKMFNLGGRHTESLTRADQTLTDWCAVVERTLARGGTRGSEQRGWR